MLEGGRGADRKNRKKLFKAVSEGNFDDFDFEYEEEMMMEAGRELLRLFFDDDSAADPIWTNG